MPHQHMHLTLFSWLQDHRPVSLHFSPSCVCHGGRKFGVFRLTDPGGMGVISRCNQRGFHSHPAPSDGSPIYSHSASVFFNPSIKFDVVDLR